MSGGCSTRASTTSCRARGASARACSWTPAKELFEGNEPLFEGLAIHDRWDWSVRHPVLRLSFGSGNFKEPGQLALNLKEQLAAAERRAGVVTDYDTASGRLSALLEALHRQAGQTVTVLVDEYDKPILDALDAPEVARANRDFLRGLYAVVKDCDAHIRFSFITGVSKFSKVSLFSGLNNLTATTPASEGAAAALREGAGDDRVRVVVVRALRRLSLVADLEQLQMGGPCYGAQ